MHNENVDQFSQSAEILSPHRAPHSLNMCSIPVDKEVFIPEAELTLRLHMRTKEIAKTL